MLLSSTRYAFVVCASEIMFLRFDIIEKVEYMVPEGREPVDLFVEPHLTYSEPIKFEDVLDEDDPFGEEDEEEDEEDEKKKRSVSVKLALLYLLYLSTEEGWEAEADTGSSMNYAARTKYGEGWRPKLSFCKLDSW
jgi:hypothetical protein